MIHKLRSMRLGKFSLGMAFVCALFMTGCSMQKPGAKVDSVRADREDKPVETPQEQNLLQVKKPLKVNYLTPLCDIRSPEVFVYKEKRRLYVVQSDVLVRDYPVGLGFSPKGDKEKRGDGKTPEGDFFICMKNPESKFNKSLGLSYPNKKHAEKGFLTDLITLSEFRDILVSGDRKSQPPWNTSLGGQIFIHGGGGFADWTEGCIALYDSDMKELFTITYVGTPVSVIP